MKLLQVLSLWETLEEYSKAEEPNKYLENYMGFYANVKTGKNLCFYEIKIFDDLGNLVSDVLMTGMKKRIK